MLECSAQWWGKWPWCYSVAKAPSHNISNEHHHRLPPSMVKSSPIMTGAVLYHRLAFIAIINGPAGIRLAAVHSERGAEINTRRRRVFSSMQCLKIHPCVAHTNPGPKAGKGRSQSIIGEDAHPRLLFDLHQQHQGAHSIPRCWGGRTGMREFA